jgi:hypothetical protein
VFLCVFFAGRDADDRLMGPRELRSRLRMLQLVESDAWDAPGLHTVMRASLREGLDAVLFYKKTL